VTTNPCDSYVGNPDENLPCIRCQVPWKEHIPSSHDNEGWYIIEGINPEPWTAPTAMTGRKGGKTFARLVQSDTLRSFQLAVKEEFPDQNGHVDMAVTDVALQFFIWRQLPSYEIEDGRKSRRHVADATNLQKALEDALQGILFKNDRQVTSVSTTIVEQAETTTPLILIHMEAAEPVPAWVMGQAEHMRTELAQDKTNEPRELPDDNLF
jgi:Holliday junction resolvase RusA-like endonuclease